MKHFLSIILAIAALLSCYAGIVRILPTGDDKMEPIRLKVGNTTILRFAGKPHKTVLGNTRFFKVGYVENDVTIQPLGEASTNLFVYTKSGSYGFILTANTFGEYDDLVKVHRKQTSGRYLLARKTKRAQSPTLSLTSLKASVEGVTNPQKGMLEISLKVGNKTLQKIPTGKIRPFVTFKGKRVSPQKAYFKKASLAPKETTEAKVVLILEEQETQGLKLHLAYKGESAEITLHGRNL